MAEEQIPVRDEALTLVKDRFELAKKARNLFDEKWNRFYKLYRFSLNDAKQPYQSNLFVPYTFSNVETVLPRMIANRPKVQYSARTPEDAPKAVTMTNLLDYQWNKMDMDTKIAEWVKQSLIYGTSFLKVYWRLHKNGEYYDCPDADVVDNFDIFVDPDATCIEDAKYVIHRIMRPLDEVKKDPKYKNTENIKASAENRNEFRQERMNVLGQPDSKDTHKNEVELLEYWEDDRVVTVANRSTVIRDEENPFDHKKKPFIAIVDQAVPREFYGIGEIEPIESLQNELNDLRNQRMDNVNLVLNRMWKARRGADIQWDTLESRPNGVVLTDDMEDIEALTTPDITASSYREEESIKSDIQNTSGVTDYITGITGNAQTATEIVKKVEESNFRFRMKISNLENMGIKPLGEFILYLNKQYMDTEKVIKITGGDTTEYAVIGPQDIDGDFDVVVEQGSSLPIDKEGKRAKALELNKIFAQNPLIDQSWLAKQILEAYDVKDVQSAMNTQETTNEMNTPVGMHVMPDGSVMQNEEMQALAQSQMQTDQMAQQVNMMEEAGAPVMADNRPIPKGAQARQSQYANSGANTGR